MPHPPKPTATAASSNRLLSLDALRGFDMFWIMGGDGLAGAIGGLSQAGWIQGLAQQLEHVEWHGFRFYDMIFPLFVYIVGVSLVFSLGRTIAREGRAVAFKRMLRRFLLMYAIAILYHGGFANAWPDIRLVGVLHRIAFCYLSAGILVCFLKWRGLLAACVSLLVGYWAMMSFTPFPDVRPVDATGQLLSQEMTATNVSQLNWASTNLVKGVFEPGFNYANYIDQKYLPGKKWDKTWDPEGLLSTLPAIGTCLLGVLAGLLLSNPRLGERRKVLTLLIAGVGGVIAGFLWDAQFPVIKKIWTSSFVLVAGGYSCLLLGTFYYMIDVLRFNRWCTPFVWYGMNPITVYLADNIIGFRRLSTRFFGTDVKAFLDLHVTAGFGELILACGEVGIGMALVWFLYRRKIFLRL